MQKNRVISGRILLAIYLLIAWNCSIAQYNADFVIPHSHSEFEDKHHEHHFHIGIFHFLGHLLEELRHVDFDNLNENHLVLSSDFKLEKSAEKTKIIGFYTNTNPANKQLTDLHLLNKPPPYLAYSTPIFLKSDNPLRAPPCFP